MTGKMMKTELKLVENPSDFRKYGICCKFGFIRTICTERGKSYANMSRERTQTPSAFIAHLSPTQRRPLRKSTIL